MFSGPLTKSIAVGATVIVLAGGAYQIVNASSGGASGTASAAQPAKVIPFDRGSPSVPKVVGQVPHTTSTSLRSTGRTTSSSTRTSRSSAPSSEPTR
jgi:hypothetical protein